MNHHTLCACLHLRSGILALASMSSLFVAGSCAATAITSVPFTITASGTYTLTKNLTLSGTNQTAITVNASNVLIDLKGFTLGTNDTTFSNSGITVSAASAFVTIQNGSLNNFGAGVSLFGPEETVQNLSIVTGGPFAVNVYNSCTSTMIQNCFIAGSGQNIGIQLSGCADVVVKNNHIVNENQGATSQGNNMFIANYFGSCALGINMSSTDKYQLNVTNTCTTGFSGGIAVGNANN
jgi:hypothetical protein